MLNTSIGKKGWMGNPYPESEYGRIECIRRFANDFQDRLESDPEFRNAVDQLEGETLGCYCKPKACHGDVIRNYLEGRKLFDGIENLRSASEANW